MSKKTSLSLSLPTSATSSHAAAAARQTGSGDGTAEKDRLAGWLSTTTNRQPMGESWFSLCRCRRHRMKTAAASPSAFSFFRLRRECINLSFVQAVSLLRRRGEGARASPSSTSTCKWYSPTGISERQMVATAAVRWLRLLQRPPPPQPAVPPCQRQHVKKNSAIPTLLFSMLEEEEGKTGNRCCWCCCCCGRGGGGDEESANSASLTEDCYCYTGWCRRKYGWHL